MRLEPLREEEIDQEEMFYRVCTCTPDQYMNIQKLLRSAMEVY